MLTRECTGLSRGANAGTATRKVPAMRSIEGQRLDRAGKVSTPRQDRTFRFLVGFTPRMVLLTQFLTDFCA